MCSDTVQDVDGSDARRFNSLLSSFDMVQHVHSPTHRAGSTLDLVVTFADRVPESVAVQPPGAISDHALVTCRRRRSTCADWRRVDRDELRRALETSRLCTPLPVDTDVDQLFDTYTVQRGAARHRRPPTSPTALHLNMLSVAGQVDRHRGSTLIVVPRAVTVIVSSDVITAHTTLTIVNAGCKLRATVLHCIARKKEQYWSDRLLSCGRASAPLWRSLSPMLGRDRNLTGSTGHTVGGFAEFFKKKIDDIRSSTANLPASQVGSRATSTLASFRPFTEAEIRRIITKSPPKSSSLDPVPTFLLLEFIDLLLPFVTRLVNTSLLAGRLLVSQRHVTVTPLLKKSGLDAANMANYRPVSNLSFMSKVVERTVAIQLYEYLVTHHLLPRYQSAYRKNHSTETAFLRVWCDVLMAADRRQVTLLCLLDL